MGSFKNLPLLARGGEADIYRFSNDKILRVSRKADPGFLERSALITSLLAKAKINSPRIYRYFYYEGKAAIIMEKIEGPTMLEAMKVHPLGAVKELKEMALIQAAVLKIVAPSNLSSIYDTITRFATTCDFLDKTIIDFVLQLSHEVSKGDSLCHGDFHPGNLIMKNHVPYLIDWFDAYRGPFLSDFAHTYLLMKHVPKIPSQNLFQYHFVALLAGYGAKKYFNEMRRLLPFNVTDFSKWTVIMSFLRASYGFPSEKKDRIKYLNDCYAMSQKHIPASRWYNKI